jgi:threonine/homoserine/homoserine lactone efflux protein
MRPDLWLAFIAATLVIGLIPGPGVAAILGGPPLLRSAG